METGADIQTCDECGQPMHPTERVCDHCGNTREGSVNKRTVTKGSSSRPKRASNGLISRRHLLIAVAGIGILALVGAGLWGISQSGVDAPSLDDQTSPQHSPLNVSEWDEFSTDGVGPGARVQGAFTLEEGEYAAHSLRTGPDSVIRARVTIISGGSVDVWAIEQSNLQAYADTDMVRSGDPISTAGVTDGVELQGQVPTGEWFIVVDNTDVFGTSADNAVSVRYEITVGRELTP